MFPVVSSIEDLLQALQTERGAFFYDKEIYQLGLSAQQYAENVFNSDSFELDEKTMFPTKIASLPNVERQVIQQYIVKPNSIANIELATTVNKMIPLLEDMARDTLYLAREQFKWDPFLFSNTLDPVKWTINIAKYTFITEQSEQLLFPAHKDWGLLAIYPYVIGPGLEAIVNGQWESVEIPENCLFCYAGDIFSRITDGKVPALTHRVKQPKDVIGSRTSIIFYVDPPRHMVLHSGEQVGNIIDSKLRKIGQIK